MEKNAETSGDGAVSSSQQTLDLNKYRKVTGPLSTAELEHMRKDFSNQGEDIDKLNFDIVPEFILS
ncbi:MAG: hypothetical protein LBP71_04255 [Spirochaetaceae bacterium]|jgi:hypothetical protein|nr:hypothetical protein [Spirochaetaceae bacterium]